MCKTDTSNTPLSPGFVWLQCLFKIPLELGVVMHAFISSYSGSWSRRLAWLWEFKTSLSYGARPHHTPKKISKWMVKINWNNVCIQWPLCSSCVCTLVCVCTRVCVYVRVCMCVCMVLFPFVFWDGGLSPSPELASWLLLNLPPQYQCLGFQAHTVIVTISLGFWVLKLKSSHLNGSYFASWAPLPPPLLHCFLSTLIFRTQWKAIITSYI